MTRERLEALAPYLVEASRILRHTHRGGAVHRRVGANCCRECRLLADWLQRERKWSERAAGS